MNTKLYNSVLTYRETIEYTDNFLNNFINFLKKDYSKIIKIDLPILSNSKYGVNQFLNNIRKIEFDNYSNFELFEINMDYDILIRQLYYLFHPNEDEVMMFKFNEIIRDKKIDENNSLQSTIYNFEIRTKEENRNEKFLSKFSSNVYTGIANIVNSDKNTQKKINSRLDIISFQKIKKYYPFSSIQNSLKNIGNDKKIFGILFSRKDFENMNPYKNFIGYDFDNTIVVYCWNEFLKSIQELTTITIRPNWEKISSQTIFNLNNFEEYSNFFNLIKDQNNPTSISLKIHIDNLMSFVLEKNSINDLPSQLVKFNF